MNNATGLDCALKSVVSQYDDGLELLVIDGGSTDDFLTVIDKYKRYINYWETGVDRNLSNAFNRGISQAKGKFISILNSDDIYEEKVLFGILEYMRDSPNVDVFYGKVKYIDQIDNTSYMRIPNISHMKYRMSLFHSSMFVSKSAYDSVGLYSEDYHLAMDSEWCHRAMRA